MKHTQTGSGRRPTKGGGLPRATVIDQGELFGKKRGAADVGPATRASHPVTSHHAATKAADKLTTKQLAVLDVFQRRGYGHLSTHEEIVREYVDRLTSARSSWYPDLTDSSIRTRTKELATLGYVSKFDENGKSDRGNPATRWQLTTSGTLVDVGKLRPSDV